MQEAPRRRDPPGMAALGEGDSVTIALTQVHTPEPCAHTSAHLAGEQTRRLWLRDRRCGQWTTAALPLGPVLVFPDAWGRKGDGGKGRKQAQGDREGAQKAKQCVWGPWGRQNSGGPGTAGLPRTHPLSPHSVLASECP